LEHIIGINVFSVYKELFRDYLGTLKKLTDMGYTHIELLSHHFEDSIRFSERYPAKELKAHFQEWGAVPVAVHEIMEQGRDLYDYDWDAIIRYNCELGCERVVIPWQWFNSKEEALRIAKQLDAIGKRMKENGLQLYYHHHGHELRNIGEATTLLDILAEHSDPTHLKFQLELIWIVLAGHDPVDLMERFGARGDMTHQNDINPSLTFTKEAFFQELEECSVQGSDIMPIYRKHAANFSADLGTGTFEFTRFYSKVHEKGYVRYSIVENETKGNNKLTSVNKDLEFLKLYVR
jgi:sugar phosphate isomerase/epimerase